MIIEARGFEWAIPPKGSLRWVDVDGEPCLLEGKTGPTASRSRWYFPADNPTLFHRFGSVEPTKEGIIEFAEKFGELGTYYGGPDEDEKMGDSFREWKGELREFKIEYDLWRALKKNDEGSLQSIYSTERRLRPRPGRSLHESAWREIATGITSAFDRLVSGIQSKVSLKPEHTGLILVFEPGSLIAFIWLQFAQAVTTSDRWKFCDFCGEPFKPESMKARFCSDSHRQMAYHKRKQSKK